MSKITKTTFDLHVEHHLLVAGVRCDDCCCVGCLDEGSEKRIKKALEKAYNAGVLATIKVENAGI